ncbi:hypothetical protein [Streptomyces coelicoflavus]|uniref:hypothetical protein n=1 Tax=Streptomyces coelicoflavus TaxID=285562 RepID=UPI0036436D62
MIYRHFIAPPRAFTQFSHDLIRHPRLSSDAVRLLTWQLSLPPGTRESLSRTAERARIGGCAFTRAKRQLKDEGFVHERRLQGSGGLWVTQQLVSNVPLSEAEALKLLAQMPVGPAGTTTTERVAPPQLAPGRRSPAVGEPTPPPTDGYPPQDREGNTSNQPPEPPAADASIPQPDGDGDAEPHLPAARALVDAFPALSPDLRHIPRAMRPELTKLTACWLAAGHPPTTVRTHILRGLPDDGTPVHRPGGLLRHLLSDVPPPPPASRVPAHRLVTPTPAHPDQQQPPGPRLSPPRLAGTRECTGDHVQPLLFRPVGDETRCPRCR